MKIAFDALIKRLTTKMPYGDKEAEMLLAFRPTDEAMDTLNKLQKPDQEVVVVVMERGETK